MYIYEISHTYVIYIMPRINKFIETGRLVATQGWKGGGNKGDLPNYMEY